MNGKDIFLGLKYIGDDLVEKAEYGQFPETAKKRFSIRKSLLIAAMIALTLLLVGCAVVYLLSMGEIKLGDRQITYETYDYGPQTGETPSPAETKTETQQVLTLSGLRGTPVSQAAQEWYDFLESYDPDGAIRRSASGRTQTFPEEYYGYGLYSQEMKDKLDEILAKYDLKLQGKQIRFQTTKLMLQALGMDTVQTSGSQARIRVTYGSYYENGNLDLHFEVTIPRDEGAASDKTTGVLYYRPKDCFIPDTAVLTEAQWEEWNIATASGDQVLLIRSQDAGTAWIFNDRETATISLQLDAILDIHEEMENGLPVPKFDLLSKAQLEQVANAVDFSMEPKLAEDWETLSDGAVPAGQEINGYCVEPVSAFTDGYAYRIILRVTAPKGVALTDPENHTAGIAPGNGVWGSCVEDGDGKLNTCHFILSDYIDPQRLSPEEGMPFYEGMIIPIYWEDMYYSYIDLEKSEEVETLLTVGTWKFDVPLNDADTRQIELLTHPITAQASIGWGMDGTDALEELELTSLKIRSMGISETSGEQNGDFFCFNGQCSYVVMKDGTKVEFLYGLFNQPIDLDQVAYVQLADQTIIPMPGVDEAEVKQISEAMPTEPSEPEIPVFADGIELVTEPVTLQSLAGYANDPSGDMVPLYEYFTLTSFVLHPEGAVALDSRALERPETENQVVMQDGSQILLTNSGCGRNNGINFSTFTSEATIDLSKVNYLLLPDGTMLTVLDASK